MLKSRLFLISLFLCSLLCACNVFDALDTPTSDAQIISAARACFDQGDIDCARAWYAKLSNGAIDVRASEEAFAILHENGVSMAVFIAAVGEGQGGAGLTTLANTIGPYASQNKRLAFYSAYKKVAEIQNASIRGLTRFITAYTLAAEILAEDSGDDFTLQKTDLVADVAACSCGSCTAATGSHLTAASRVDLVGNPAGSDLSGTYPTFGMLDGALAAVNEGLVNEIAAAGKFSSGAGAFTSFLGATAPTNDACYRYALESHGVGN